MEHLNQYRVAMADTMAIKKKNGTKLIAKSKWPIRGITLG
jgi:hypothetical protein